MSYVNFSAHFTCLYRMVHEEDKNRSEENISLISWIPVLYVPSFYIFCSLLFDATYDDPLHLLCLKSLNL